MNKAKEIEEMAKVLCGHYCGKDKCRKRKITYCLDMCMQSDFTTRGIGRGTTRST